MEVTVVEATESPERVVCQSARGDYFDGYVGETEFAELMRPVNFEEDDFEAVGGDLNEVDDPEEDLPYDDQHIVEAKVRNFIHKELSRGHYGPFEHVQITLAVKGVSRTCMAQVTRHRHMTFDVQSQRYVDFSDKDTIVPKSLTEGQHLSREEGVVEMDDDTREHLRQQYDSFTQEAFEQYQDMVEQGVPKEDARFILPLGTPVNMTMSGNARTMMHVLNLRQTAASQWESRELAEKISEKLDEWALYTGEWWRDHGPVRNSP